MLNSVLNDALAHSVPWQKAYGIVEEEAKRVLNATARDTRLTTTQFVDLIYSKEGPWSDAVRRRLFKALVALSTRGMVRYVQRGEIEQIGRLKGQRRLWGYPTQEVFPPTHPECPTCHRPLNP